MDRKYLLILLSFLLFSCSNQQQILYVGDIKNNSLNKIDYSFSKKTIKTGDVLKIDINTIIPEVAVPYNTLQNPSQNIDNLIISGYLVDDELNINFPWT